MSGQIAKKADDTFSYDEVPYESFTYPQSHPSHLATIATLFGLKPADFKKARVLELGCASGGNLFPLAQAYPQAHFTGLDLSQEQITLANTQKAEMKLTNIDFKQQDIMAFDVMAHEGKFDYVICHGVFSWVPEPVQHKILEICNECMSKDGLALISYNTLPGWNAVRSLRDMMLYHTNMFTSPKEKVKQARQMLDFLAENVSPKRAGYLAVIEDERKLLKNINDSYLFHDHLEKMNTQFYFHDFVKMAGTHRLSYLGDAGLSSMFVGNLPKKAIETLGAVNDIIKQEQYMDFVTNRRFRCSILCKAPEKVKRQLQDDMIMNYFLTTPATPDAPDDKGNITFKTPGGAQFTTNTPLGSALYLELVATGVRPISAKDLVARVAKKQGLATPDDVQKILMQTGLQLALRGCVNLHSDSPAFTDEVSKKPVVSPLARYQASIKGCHKVTSMLGSMVNTDAIANIIIKNLDGTRTAQDIVDILAKQAENNLLKVEKDKATVTNMDDIRKELAKTVDVLLPRMAKQALLIG